MMQQSKTIQEYHQHDMVSTNQHKPPLTRVARSNRTMVTKQNPIEHGTNEQMRNKMWQKAANERTIITKKRSVQYSDMHQSNKYKTLN